MTREKLRAGGDHRSQGPGAACVPRAGMHLGLKPGLGSKGRIWLGFCPHCEPWANTLCI